MWIQPEYLFQVLTLSQYSVLHAYHYCYYFQLQWPLKESKQGVIQGDQIHCYYST